MDGSILMLTNLSFKKCRSAAGTNRERKTFNKFTTISVCTTKLIKVRFCYPIHCSISCTTVHSPWLECRLDFSKVCSWNINNHYHVTSTKLYHLLSYNNVCSWALKILLSLYYARFHTAILGVKRTHSTFYFVWILFRNTSLNYMVNCNFRNRIFHIVKRDTVNSSFVIAPLYKVDIHCH